MPPNITALDALLKKDKSETELDDLEYQFRVVYTFDNASKGKAHIEFVSPDTEEGKSIQNVLQKFKSPMNYTDISQESFRRLSKSHRKAILNERSHDSLAETQDQAADRIEIARKDE